MKTGRMRIQGPKAFISRVVEPPIPTFSLHSGGKSVVNHGGDILFPMPRWLLLVGLLTAAACRNADQTQNTSSEVPRCSEPDGGQYVCMGCAVPAATWADAGVLSCPRSIADYCDQNRDPIPATTPPDCPPSDWDALLAFERAYTGPPVFYECDAFNLASPGWWCGSGTNVLFVYDKASGRLTTAIEEMAGQQTCLAGPGTASYVARYPAGCTAFHCIPLEAVWDGGPCDFDAGAD